MLNHTRTFRAGYNTVAQRDGDQRRILAAHKVDGILCLSANHVFEENISQDRGKAVSASFFIVKIHLQNSLWLTL